MKYTKSIFFKDGKSLTITEDECVTIKQRLIAGDKWLEVQGDLISHDNIARVGRHESTDFLKRIDNQQKLTSAKYNGTKPLIGSEYVKHLSNL